jgi:hypothetical protein
MKCGCGIEQGTYKLNPSLCAKIALRVQETWNQRHGLRYTFRKLLLEENKVLPVDLTQMIIRLKYSYIFLCINQLMTTLNINHNYAPVD